MLSTKTVSYTHYLFWSILLYCISCGQCMVVQEILFRYDGSSCQPNVTMTNCPPHIFNYCLICSQKFNKSCYVRVQKGRYIGKVGYLELVKISPNCFGPFNF